MLTESRIPVGYLVRKIWRDILVVLLISLLVEIATEVNRGYVPVVPAAMPAFLGTAISLVLSFKLSQSYDRWWEARKIWGAIVNDSRTLVRQGLTFFGSSEVASTLAHRQIAWCYCLGRTLRGQSWRDGFGEHLADDEVEEVERHANKALALLQLHARDLSRLSREGCITDYQRVAVDETLTRLTDSMGKAERIRNTVFPRTYRLVLHASIYLFITLLAIALAEIAGAWPVTIPTVVAVPFFLLEKTASDMQDPFANRPTDTPVTAIARTIEINILQLMGEDDVPEPLEPMKFYLM